MRIEVDKGQLDDIEQEAEDLRQALHLTDDPQEVRACAESLLEELDMLLESIEDSSDWERKFSKEDDDEDE